MNAFAQVVQGTALIGDRVAIIAGTAAFMLLFAGSVTPGDTWRLLPEPERGTVRMRGLIRRAVLLGLGVIAGGVFLWAVLTLPMAPAS